MAKIKIINKFGGKGAEEYNVLATALIECGKDRKYYGEYPEYEFLENTPRTTIVVRTVDKLKEMGYKIIKS